MVEKKYVQEISDKEKRCWDKVLDDSLKGVKDVDKRKIIRQYAQKGVSITPKSDRDDDFQTLTGRILQDDEKV